MSLYFLLILVFAVFFVIFIFNPVYYSYSPEKARRYLEKYSLPQLDDDMHVSYISSTIISFDSDSEDSTIHSYKTLYRDLVGLDNITDIFKNKHTGQVLEMNFIVPNFVRKSETEITLTTGEGKSCVKKKISRVQCDSVLKAWNLYGKAYAVPSD
jgi:ABC-type sugar transport system permease subunit